MKITELKAIIDKHFYDYPLEPDLKAILMKVNTRKICIEDVDVIFKDLRKNMVFFEKHRLTHYGLFNLFMYAFDASYTPEEHWDRRRAPVTTIYKIYLDKNGNMDGSFSKQLSSQHNNNH